MRRALLVCGVLVGCKQVTSTSGEPDAGSLHLSLTIEGRAAVREPRALDITFDRAGVRSTVTQQLGFAGLPATVTIEQDATSEPLAIEVEAFDGNGIVVGRGRTHTSSAASAAYVMLQNTDFVVNSALQGNQFLSNDSEAAGLQLAGAGNTWFAAFRDDCTSCNLYGRRFDDRGIALVTPSGTQQFVITLRPTTTGAIPAVTQSGLSGWVLAVWDFAEPDMTSHGIACRVFDHLGAPATAQHTLAAESADVVTAAPLLSGNFIVTWQSVMMSQIIRAVVVNPDCSTTMAPMTVSTTSGTFGARRSHVASNGDTILFAWIVDGSLHLRIGFESGSLGTEQLMLSRTASEQIEHVRVAPWGPDYVVVVRWAGQSPTLPGKIELYRVSQSGQLTQGPIQLTIRSGSDFASVKGFGLASRYDGTLLVAWHACPAGPGSCDVFGRLVSSTGALGDELLLATTTDGDQINPSVVALYEAFVVAWNDASGSEPDPSGGAVRARIIYVD